MQKIYSNMTIHRVMAGETLASIASKYNTAVSLLERDNGPDCLYEGARLIVRTGIRLHVVKPFERLDVIARRYGVALSDVVQENNLASPAVYAGQQLIIPKGQNEQDL